MNVPVTVNAVNDAPVVNNDTPSTPEDTPATINVLANDTDVDGTLVPGTIDLDPATPGVQTTFTVAGQGTFTVNPVTGVVTFTPVANFNGTTTPVTYQVCDNGGLCDDATITVTVNAVNDAPVANNDTPSTPEDAPVTINVLANDTDVDGTLVPGSIDLDPATPGVQTTFTVAGQGTFTVNPVTGVVTFTPVANFNGTTTPVTYQVCDNGTPLPAQCDDATITVTVTPANDVPTITQGPVTTNEDAPVVICPTVGDSDMGDVLTVSPCAVPANGTLVSGPGNCVTFTPNPNFNGTQTVCIQVCDQTGACATVNVPVTVNAVNDAPVVNNDTPSTPEDTPATINVLANDTDVDGTLVPGTIDLDPATPGVQTTFTVAGQGTFTVNPVTGVVTFTPVANFNGTTTPVTYQVCDNGGLCDDATITVTVNAVNDAPVANNDTPSTPEDAPVTINVLANDTDVDGTLVPGSIDLDPATPGVQTTFTVAGQGTFTVNPVTGVVTFTPVANFNGTTTPVTYQVCDNGTPLPAQCDDATITVTVTPANDVPTITQGPVTTNEDAPVVICPTVGDSDMGDVLTVSPCALPANGTLVSGPGNCVTFTPNPNFNGTQTVCIQVCDQNGACATVNVPVTVTAVNDAPVANNDTPSTPEDTPATINVLANDTDVDGTLVPGTIDLDPATPGVQTTFTVAGQGTFTVDPVTGVVTFTPVANFTGTTTPVTYQVCDNGTPLPAQCDDATITVTVTPVNDVPTITQGPVTTNEDAPVVICPTVGDSDMGAVLTVSPCAVPANGTLVSGPGNCVTFTPNPNFNGTQTVCIQVCDQNGACATVNVPVTVTPVNDAPTITQGPVTTNEDAPVVICPTVGDPDMGDVLTVSPCAVPANGTLVSGPGNCVTFTPNPNFNGTQTVCIQVCDQNGVCATVNVPVTVTAVNDAPVANNDTPSTPEDTPVTINILANDTDVDGTLVPGTIDLDPATPGVQTTFTVAGQGTFTVNPVTGVVTFVPASNFVGTVNMSYSVCDNGTPLPAQCGVATVTVTVVFDPIAKLQVKAMLQGAMIGTSDGLMRDDLRSGGYLPLTEPYTALSASNPRFTHVGGGGETTTSAVLAANAGTGNAIVDWVFVELRNAVNPTVVVQTRSGLVQRDGDIVSPTDGVSPLTFTGFVGQQYYVAVKHRNHLGAMTATAVTMSNDLTIVDFINATNAQIYNRPGTTNYDGMETVLVSGKRALWAGNTNADGKVKYQGTASDNIPILTQVLGHPSNTSSTYNFNAAFGYYSGDVNMDGKVKYQGPQNDVTFIFVNKVGLYLPLNTLGLYNYDLFIEQLP